MRWLKSTTQKAYQFDGKTIPRCVTKGNEYLALSDHDYNELLKNNVVKSLVNAGAILVTDKEPLTPTTQVSNLTKEKADLIRRNTELQEKLNAMSDSVPKSELDAMKVKYADLEKEAQEALQKLQAEIDELKAGK